MLPSNMRHVFAMNVGVSPDAAALAGSGDIYLNGKIRGYNAANIKFEFDAATGNGVLAGTLGVTGATILSSTLAVTGNLSVNTNKFIVDAATGNITTLGNITVNTNKLIVNATTGDVTIAGELIVQGGLSGDITGTLETAAQPNITSVGTLTSLAVSGNITGTIATAAQAGITSVGTLTSLAVLGNITVNTNKFTVTGSNGNTLVAGTLDVTGNLAVNTNKFTVAAASGNTVIAGTLSVSGSVLGAFSHAAGLVSAPSINFGDATTGLYKYASNAIGIAISGGVGAVLDASGNFGLGDTPSTAFHMKHLGADMVTLLQNNSGTVGISNSNYIDFRYQLFNYGTVMDYYLGVNKALNSGGPSDFGLYDNANSKWVFSVDYASGKLYFGGNVGFGSTNANLYYQATDTIKSDGSFIAKNFNVHTGTISSWVASGSYYYADVTVATGSSRNSFTYNMVDSATNMTVGIHNIETTNSGGTNIRVWMTTNTVNLNYTIIKY